MARSYKELISDLNFSYYPSENRTFRERVILVHFFGGRHRLLKRHIKLLNEIGLDVYGFDFSYRKKTIYKKIPLIFRDEFRLQKIWTNELRDVLAYVPGPTVVYSFSGPSSCSISIAAESTKKIKGLISDSGPFTNLLHCNYNLAAAEFRLSNPILRAGLSALISPLWNLNHTQNLKDDLTSLPKAFPYLSIQPVQDMVVPVKYMKSSFDGVRQRISLEEVEFQSSGHLDALKTEPAKYSQTIRQWFKANFGSEV